MVKLVQVDKKWFCRICYDRIPPEDKLMLTLFGEDRRVCKNCSNLYLDLP